MKKALFITLILASAYGHAAQDRIEKVANPGQINIVKDGSSVSLFYIRVSDFPKGVGSKPKKLSKIEWHTTHYPENLNEEVELCYYPHGSSTVEICEDLSPNASDHTEVFNQQVFDYYSRAMIRHKIKGGKKPGRPAGQDKVVFHYTY